MVKFGHNFPKLQKEEWKEEYLNYKLLKHYIKVEKNKNEKIDQKELIRTFINMLNKEIKKVYLFYVQQEREIYIMINSHLHIRNTYDTMNSQSINSEVSELIKIIKLAYDLLSYIKANMTGVQKILKKFDKKFHEEIKGKIRDKFLNDKLSNDNSDIVYIFQFKIINEVCALVEDLKFDLFAKYKAMMEREKKNVELISKEYNNNSVIDNDFSFNHDDDSNSGSKEKLVNVSDENNTNIVSTVSQNEVVNEIEIKTNFSLIDVEIGKIERVFLQLKNMYKVWNTQIKFAIMQEKVSFDDIFSRSISEEEILRSLNRSADENDAINISNSNVKNSQGNLSTSSLISKENFSNVILTFIHSALLSSLMYIILPHIFFVMNTQYFTNRSAIIEILMVFPLADAIAYTFSGKWASVTFKKPMMLSFLLVNLSCLSYSIGIHKRLSFLLIIGRLIGGFAYNAEINRLYIANYVPKRKKSLMLLIHKISGMIGKVLGILIQLLIYSFMSDKDIKIFIMPSSVIAFFCFIMLIVVFFLYSEPLDFKFNKYNDNQSQSDHSSTMGGLSIESSLTNQDSETIKILNKKLKKLNEDSQFTDTNLVTKAIENIIIRNKNKARVFFLLTTVVLLNKFFLYSVVLIVTQITIAYSAIKSSLCLLCTFTFSIPLYLVNYFYLSKKISSRLFFIILLISLPIINAFILLFKEISTVIIIILMIIAVLLSMLVEDTSLHMFSKLIPYDYSPVFNISSISIIQFISHIGIISSCFILIEIKVDNQIKIIGLSEIAIYCLSLLFSLVMYKELKERPISRLVRLRSTRKFKRTQI